MARRYTSAKAQYPTPEASHAVQMVGVAIERRALFGDNGNQDNGTITWNIYRVIGLTNLKID